jgi:hypothetical protein
MRMGVRRLSRTSKRDQASEPATAAWSRPMGDQTANPPPPIDTSHSPASTFGKGRTYNRRAHVRGLFEPTNRRNVRMVQCGQHPRLALEPRPSFRVRRVRARITFTATSGPSLVSLARYTSPMPPTPIWAGSSYGPSRVPGSTRATGIAADYTSADSFLIGDAVMFSDSVSHPREAPPREWAPTRPLSTSCAATVLIR